MTVDDCFSKNVVEHVPFNWSKLATKFLQFPNHRICVAVTGKRVNRGAGFGPEIPVECIFYGHSRITTWLRKSLEKLDNSLKCKSRQVCQIRTFENQIKALFYFPTKIWGVCYKRYIWLEIFTRF